MARPTKSSLPIVAALFLAATWGCTTNKQEAPPLTGPSELGTSIAITVSPDVLRQDGASQSLVTVTARDNQGQPLRNLTLRAAITVGGTITDFGSLSARNVVTDANGRATLIYTAPPAGPVAIDTGTVVGISVSPMGTDFGNSTSKTVDIRLVPSGVIGAPPSALKVAINIPPAVVGDTAVFTANITDAAGADASASVASYQWTFGDGSTASGRTASHTYSQPGNYAVTLTITDVLGRVGQTAQSISVGGGTNPTATFFVSPSSPNVGQPVTFNASTAVAAPGHNITSYAWDFGDGTTGSGVTTTHTYSATGSYTVILITTDGVGRKGTQTQTISVGAGGLTPDFNFSPSSPAVGQSVSFDGTPSKASSGRSITSYAWNFDDGTTGSGPQTSHTYNRPGTFVVRLTITDDLGNTASVTKSVTAGATSTLTADFSFSPSTPVSGQTVNFDGSLSRPGTGRTITQYAWNFDDGGIAFGVTTVHSFNPPNPPATFNVRLTITDDLGQTATTTKAVPVAASTATTADFTAQPNPASPNQPVAFDASLSRPGTGRTIRTYLWNFDDGTTATGVTTSHSFTTSRTYNVRLTVTDDTGQTATTSKSVVVASAPPTASFVFLPQTPDVNQQVSFDASASTAAFGRTITNYSWNFGDGTPIVSGPSRMVTHAYTTAATYTAILTVTDDAGQTNTTSRTVPVASNGPVTVFTFTPNSPAPVGTTFTFDASASRAAANSTINRYQWQFLGTPNTAGQCAAPVLPGGPGAPGGPIVTTTSPIVTNQYNSANTYCVFLTIFDNNGGSNSTFRVLTVQ